MSTEAETAALQAQALIDSLADIVPKALVRATEKPIDGSWVIPEDKVDDMIGDIAQQLIALGYQR